MTASDFHGKPVVPDSVKRMDADVVVEVLSRDGVNVSDAADELNVASADLRRLLWGSPRIDGRRDGNRRAPAGSCGEEYFRGAEVRRFATRRCGKHVHSEKQRPRSQARMNHVREFGRHQRYQ